MKSIFSPLLMLGMLCEMARAECTVQVEMDEAIGPATLDLFDRTVEFAKEKSCQSILILINTPGGSLYTTRIIVERIVNSEIPILCLVHPSGGGHAGSAGAIILQACHVNGASPVTNLGAATPIAGTGAELPEDLRKKILNDTTSWLDGITTRRRRNQKFGRDIVTEAKAVSAEEALKLKAIDVVPKSIEEFLQFSKDRSVQMVGERMETVQVGELLPLGKDLRHQVLAFLTDPEFAYLLLMVGLALLYYEITHTGLVAPGVIGAICLVVAMIGLHKLDVQYGGLALIFLGLIFLFLEIIVPGLGMLGVGGITSFVVGSLFLFKRESGFAVPLTMIVSTACVFGGIMAVLTYLAAQTYRRKRPRSVRDWDGKLGIIVSLETSGRRGQIDVLGEIWNFLSDTEFKLGDEAEVLAMENMSLKVQPREKTN